MENKDMPLSAETQELILKTCKDIKRSNKIRNVFTAFAALACLGMFITVFIFTSNAGPKINTALDDINTVTESLDAEKISVILEDTEKFAKNAAEVANKADSSLEGAGEAVKKLEEIDIDKLNEAIDNLNKTVKPLADFFSKFGR